MGVGCDPLSVVTNLFRGPVTMVTLVSNERNKTMNGFGEGNEGFISWMRCSVFTSVVAKN